MADAYRDDLAYIHDAGFGQLATASAPVLLEALRRSGHDHGLVVDLGCGSGLLSERLVEARYDVLGIDISQSMIDLARAKVPRGRFVVGSILTAELPPCIAVAAVGECFNYLFDPGNTKVGLVRLFGRIHVALEPGGLLLFDVAGPGRVPEDGPRRAFSVGEDWAVLAIVEEDRRRGVLTRSMTTFRRVGELYRRDEEVHRQRLYRASDLASELRAIGFRARILRGYGSYRFPPGLAGILARKR